jgi:hypothetical protein
MRRRLATAHVALSAPKELLLSLINETQREAYMGQPLSTSPGPCLTATLRNVKWAMS